MPGQTIFENLEAGLSVKEITEVFDVTEQVSNPCCTSQRRAWKKRLRADEDSIRYRHAPSHRPRSGGT